MNEYNAAAFVKLGSCLRYLIDAQAGSAIGRARPDPGQPDTARVNARGEKIQSDSNVLSNMYQVEALLREVDLASVRTSEQEYLRKTLAHDATTIMNADAGHGVLTAELAAELAKTARKIRDGVLERAQGVTLHRSGGWPKEFDSKLCWPVPWWLILIFMGLFGAGVGFAETPLYSAVSKWFYADNGNGAELEQVNEPVGRPASQPSAP